MLGDLLHETERTGLVWSLVLFEDGYLHGRARELGIESFVLPAGRLRQAGRYRQTLRSLAAIADRADVVLAWMPKAHLYTGPAAHAADRPALWFQHGNADPRSAIDRLAALLPASGVIVCSHAAEASQRRIRPHRPTRVVHPCVDLERFRPEAVAAGDEARRTVALPADVPVVGIVSRLQSWKGIHLAIKALPRVHESFPTAMLVIVGGPHFSEPHYEHELRMTAARLGVSDRVVFAGLQDDVRPWLSAMDVLVHPARNEPFGISILEAMALGRPVVASDSGGPLEIIDDGRNGLLFRTGDPGSLAERVVRLLGSPAEAARLAEQARVRATEFSSSRMAEKIGAAVRQLTGLDVERR